MTAPSSAQPPLHLYWRPGCPFCLRLRLGLRRKGMSFVAHNIWEDGRAAAFVRSVTGGDETVPTVTIGERALVNPTLGEVLDLLGREAPDLLAQAGRRGLLARLRRS
jgi:mycoredoxin